MKKFRKIMAVLVAAIMIVATMVPAWAATSGVPGAHTLTYDVDETGGTEADTTQTANGSGEITLNYNSAANPTHPDGDEGYGVAFIGWTETPNSHIYAADESLTAEVDYWTTSKQIVLTDPKTVYALWGYDYGKDGTADVGSVSPTTVSYNGKGGSPVPASVKIPAGDYYLASTTVPEKAGYVFKGWTAVEADAATVSKTDNPSNELKAKWLAPGTKVTVSTDPTTYYAVWAEDSDGDGVADFEEAKYTVNYYLKETASKNNVTRTILGPSGATFNSATDFTTSFTATETNVVAGPYTLQKLVSDPGTKVKYNVEQDEAYVGFIGWTTNEDEAWKIYGANDTIAHLVSEETLSTQSNPRIYYAVWGFDDDHDGVPNYNEVKTPDQNLAAGSKIVVTPAANGETYYAYRMLKLFVDDTSNPTAFAYTVDEDWVEFFNNPTNYTGVFTINTEGYFTSSLSDEPNWGGNSSTLSAFAEKAAKYAKDHNLPFDGTAVGGSNKAEIEVTTSGYYLISSTLGTIAMINSLPGKDNTIKEKNFEDTIDKDVKEDSTDTWVKNNDAQVGDTVYFKSKVTIKPRSINVKIHDTMHEGLSLNVESIKLFLEDGTTEGLDDDDDEYLNAVIKTTGISTEDFVIEIPDELASTVDTNQILWITYDAQLTEKAVKESGTAGVYESDDVTNETYVTYGNDGQSATITTTTVTHKFEVKKVKEGGTDLLADAIFELHKNGTPVKLYKLSDTVYRVADSEELDDSFTSHVAKTAAGNTTGEVETITAGTLVDDFVTVSTGNIVIWGVDSDDDYTLVEIQAPKGYILPGTAIAVDDSSDSIDGVAVANTTEIAVENSTTSELPRTGGMGTTVLYIVGGMLVILAGAYLFFSRKKVA